MLNLAMTAATKGAVPARGQMDCCITGSPWRETFGERADWQSPL